MIESLNALHLEYINKIQTQERIFMEREASLDELDAVLDQRERAYNDRVKALENRENAVAQVRDIASRRKAEIEVLKQEAARLVQQASDARAAQRVAEEKARKIGEGIGFLKSLAPAI